MDQENLANPILLFLLFGLSVFLVIKFNRSKYKLPPSPPKLPLVGNLHQLRGLPHHALHSLSSKYGPVMLLHLGRMRTIVVSSADVARDVMKTYDHLFCSRPQMLIPKRLLYGNKDVAFAPYGEYWRQARKVCVLQLLSAKKVQSFQFVREQEIADMMETIKLASSSSVVNLSQLIISLSNNITCRVALGRKYDQGESGMKFRNMIYELTYLISVFNLADLVPLFSWVNYVNGLNKRVESNFRNIDSFLDEVIKEHIEKMRGGDDSTEEEEEEDFVDVMLRIEDNKSSGIQLERDSIKAIILDMFAAGTDTTSIVLEWAMSELVRNPVIMNEVQKELRDTFKGNILLKEPDVQELQYLQLVVKETLRLHPPVPLLGPRESMEFSVINGYDVPAKTTIMINAFAIGRDPMFWNEPYKFWPKRFLDGEKYSSIDFKGQHFQLVPFGAGRRGCPGIFFSTSIIEVALANLLYKFDWTLPNGVDSCDLDMEEGSGSNTHRKTDLILNAESYYF